MLLSSGEGVWLSKVVLSPARHAVTSAALVAWPNLLLACSLAHRYATSRATQYKWLVKKYFAVWWRSPNYSERLAGWHAAASMQQLNCRGRMRGPHAAALPGWQPG